MKRVLATVLAGLLLLASTAMAMDWTRVAERLRHSVTRMDCVTHEKPVCTVFSINEQERFYLTAAHCVEEEGGFTIDGQPVEVVLAADIFDLAVVRASKGREALQLREPNVQTGMEVLSYGYGYGMNFPLAKSANIAAVSQDRAGTVYPILDTPFVQGMSGGPVVDGQARVIGVISASDNYTGLVVGSDRVAKVAGRYFEPR